MRDALALVMGRQGRKCVASVPVKMQAKIPRSMAVVDSTAPSSLSESCTGLTSDSCDTSLQDRHSRGGRPTSTQVPQASERRDLRSDLSESGCAKHGSKQGAPSSDVSLNAVAGDAATECW